MNRIRLYLAGAVLSVFLFSIPALAEEGLTLDHPEVKAAAKMMSTLVSSCRAKDKDGVMKHLSRSAIEDTKKQPEIMDFFFEMCVDLKISEEAEITLEGEKMTIKETVMEQDWEMTQTMRLIKEDGVWKFGTE